MYCEWFPMLDAIRFVAFYLCYTSVIHCIINGFLMFYLLISVLIVLLVFIHYSLVKTINIMYLCLYRIYSSNSNLLVIKNLYSDFTKSVKLDCKYIFFV